MRKLLPLKSSHGHVEEIKEKKKHCVKQRRNLKYCRRKKKAVITVDEGSTRNRAAFRFALEEWVKGFQVEVRVEKIVGKNGFKEWSHTGKLLTQGCNKKALRQLAKDTWTGIFHYSGSPLRWPEFYISKHCRWANYIEWTQKQFGSFSSNKNKCGISPKYA